MERKRIDFLLDRYWACETTPEEEEELRLFFRNEKKLPVDLEQFRELFVFQQQESEIRLTDEFDQKILNEIRRSGASRPRLRLHLLRAVAVMVLLFSVGVIINRHSSTVPLYEPNPEQALEEVQKALYLVSQRLNQGQQLVEKNINQMEIVTRYIK